MSKVTLDLIEAEKKAKNITIKNHSKEFDLLTALLNLYTNGLSLLPSLDSKTGDVHWVWLFLITRSFFSIRCAVELMAKAYYAQAIALLRIAIEAYFLCANCEKDRTIIEALLHNKTTIFNYRKLATAINVLPIFKDDYKFACNYSHTSALSLGTMTIETDASKRELRPIPLYDDMSFIACCALSFRGGLLMADFLERLLRDVSRERVTAWRDEAKTGVQQLKEWLGELKGKYGSQEVHR